MKDETEKLSRAIHALTAALRSSGKRDTAQFFEKLAEEVVKPEQRTEFLARLVKSGAMIHYCDFSPDEERLWNEVFVVADKIVSP